MFNFLRARSPSVTQLAKTLALGVGAELAERHVNNMRDAHQAPVDPRLSAPLQQQQTDINSMQTRTPQERVKAMVLPKRVPNSNPVADAKVIRDIGQYMVYTPYDKKAEDLRSSKVNAQPHDGPRPTPQDLSSHDPLRATHNTGVLMVGQLSTTISNMMATHALGHAVAAVAPKLSAPLRIATTIKTGVDLLNGMSDVANTAQRSEKALKGRT